MATPRSTAPGSVTKCSLFRGPVTVPTLAAAATGSITVNLPRSFKPGKDTEAFWLTGSGGGLTIAGVNVTGNSPTYVATLYFTNLTGASITGASQNLCIVQE
jgi:hypothetical protein